MARCLRSAASMPPRRASAVCQSWASSRLAPVSVRRTGRPLAFAFFGFSMVFSFPLATSPPCVFAVTLTRADQRTALRCASCCLDGELNVLGGLQNLDDAEETFGCRISTGSEHALQAFAGFSCFLRQAVEGEGGIDVVSHPVGFTDFAFDRHFVSLFWRAL